MSEALHNDDPTYNPDWTPEQNRVFDQAHDTRGLPAAQARRILGLEPADVAAIKSDSPKPKLGGPKTRSSRPKPRRSGFGIKADIADSDKRVQDYYEMFE